MDWKLFAGTFGAVFVAELGDKTQLACMVLTAQSRSPWTIFLAGSAALVLAAFLGVMVADYICRFVSTDVLKKIAAVAFVVMGIFIYFDKL